MQVKLVKSFILDELNGSCNSLAEYKRCLELFCETERPRFNELVDLIISNFINLVKEQRVDFPDFFFKMAGLVTNIHFVPPKQYPILLNALSPLMKSDFFIDFKNDKTGE